MFIARIAFACLVTVAMVGCSSGLARSGSGVSSATASTSLPSRSTGSSSGDPWLAFQWMAGADGIFLTHTDGSDRHQLVPDLAGTEIHPDWSPDGGRIAFVRFTPTDQSELWVVNVDGSGAERLASCETPCNSFDAPDWSTDGRSILFSEDADAPANGPPATFQFARYDIATRTVSVVLTRADGMTAESPRLSPDGSQVVYHRYRDIVDSTQGSALFVCDLLGGSERQLTDWEMQAAYPDWSTDDLIVFTTYNLGEFQTTTKAVNLFTIRPDGSAMTQLTQFGESAQRATQPRWAPDGSGIVFTRVTGTGYGTRTADFLPVGGGGSPFTGAAIIATHPELQPRP